MERVSGERRKQRGAAASWLTYAPPSLPMCSLLDQQQLSGTHLSGFTALSLFFGLKNEKERERKIREGKETRASCSLAPGSMPTSGSTLSHLVPTTVQPHA